LRRQPDHFCKVKPALYQSFGLWFDPSISGGPLKRSIFADPNRAGPEAMQQTIARGVQRGLFGYALGDGEEFDTIYYRDSHSSEQFAIIDGAWLLRPALAERLLKKGEPPPPPAPEDEEEKKEKE
jgi:hypothetical protein